jgi:16S rRNA processing protein RimM
VPQQVIVGEIAGAYGVKGWVKIFSHTQPPQNILGYKPWRLEGKDGSQEYQVISGRLHSGAVVAQLDGINDRDQALALKSSKILVPKSCFPPLEPSQYYWADLIGLAVINLENQDLGKVVEFMETGANDVMIAQSDRERLIPFVIGQYVKEVDFAAGIVRVDWDADF